MELDQAGRWQTCDAGHWVWFPRSPWDWRWLCPIAESLAFDGDGALLMNACGLPTLAWQSPPNLTLLVFDNGIYEASGLRRTATSAGTDLMAMAKARE